MLLPLGDSFGCRIFKLVLCPILCKFPLIVQIIEERCELLKGSVFRRRGDKYCGKKGFQRGCARLPHESNDRSSHKHVDASLENCWPQGVGWLLLLLRNEAV